MEAEESCFFDPKVPHFFKIMLNEDIQTGKLTIPKKFVRKYGLHLSKFNAVLLKVPTGDTWEVELRVSGGAVRLEKGWPDFINFYSIEHGHFLMFRYESRSSNELDVVVCNKTCTEVEYLKKSRVNATPIKVEDSSEDDDVIAEEARERQPPRRVTRRTAPLRTGAVPSRITTRAMTRLRTRSNPTSNNNMLSDDSPSRLEDPAERTPRGVTNILNRRKKKGKSPSISQEETRGTLRGAERAEALNLAKSFKSSSPYFLVVMQPRYVRPPYYLNVPGRFATRYMRQEGRREMKLHISGDKIWTAGYTFRAGQGRAEAKVVHGWKTFVADNDLVLGDVCAFELIKGLRCTSFMITIFRAPRLSTFRSPRPRAQPAPLFVSEHPFFQVVVKESYLSHSYMNIPICFMRDHVSLECKSQVTTLKVGRRSWMVKLVVTCSSKHRAILSGGFSAFQKENSLEAGDTCRFELIQRAGLVFRVSISKADIAA